ncbi:MAG: DUF1302 family protein [Candidatus Binatia bacterium]
MKNRTRRSAARARVTLAAAGLLALLAPRAAHPIDVDDRGEMTVNLRAYTDARIGTEKMGGSTDPLSYPASGAGSLRQHRYFLQMEFQHDLKRLSEEGWGLARVLGWLNLDEFKYDLQYRGEWEGLYDYGPDEFSDPAATMRKVRTETPLIDIPAVPPLVPKPVKTTDRLDPQYIYERVAKIRRNARARNRFFMGYLDVTKGPVSFRIGRQVLAWGETDQFRLLDNINPLDLSFGGVFIPLDERRVPLDMVKGQYLFGNVGPFVDSFVEAFGAFGNTVATFPGIPSGSPWNPGGLNAPNQLQATFVDLPAREDWRGGARLRFIVKDFDFTIAHYYTYLDTPGIRVHVPKGLPAFDNPILAEQMFPRVPITGASVNTALPSWNAVVRSEFAYFHGEPLNRQGRGNSADSDDGIGSPGYRRLQRANNLEGALNPFTLPGFFAFSEGDLVNPDCGAGGYACRTGTIQGRLLRRDSVNWSIGLDKNHWIRWLNPNQTFFISTQFFYKHVVDSPGDLVLPVPARYLPVDRSVALVGANCGNGTQDVGDALNWIANQADGGSRPTSYNKGRPCKLLPRYYKLNDDQFLQTLLVTTSYLGGRVLPGLAMFYDWQGVVVLQPGVQLVRDPFRFIVDYTRVEGAPSGQLGAVRDRDNVRMQLEYVF